MDWTIDDEQMAAASEERTLVPAGTHQMEIVHAEEGTSEWRRHDEKNPDGACLKLRLSSGNKAHRFVFDDIPRHQPARAVQLSQAVGAAAFGSKVTLDAGELVGQMVTVEVEHYVSKAGKTSAIVKRYGPPAKAKAPAKRTATQKADAAASGGTDDIPFLWFIGAVAALSQVIA